MKRKLAIASALMHQPPILLLDEATNGLDPRAAREVKDFIRAAADSGTTIFLTTHLLDVVSELAHRVAIIHEGSLQISSTLTELRHMTGRPDASLEELFLLTTDRSFEEASAR
jgi:ABC-2 type transport system ATP-binding protein